MNILETERLVLRRLLPEDLDNLYALYSDPDIRRYFPDGTLTYEQTQEELTWFLNGHPRDPRLGLWATILKDGGRFIGRCGLLPWTVEEREEVEVAYLIAKAFWGQGLGTEAARGVLQHARERLGMNRLISLIDRDNLSSRRVAEKIGMTFEKDIVDEHGPAMVYAIAWPNQLAAQRADYSGATS